MRCSHLYRDSSKSTSFVARYVSPPTNSIAHVCTRMHCKHDRASSHRHQVSQSNALLLSSQALVYVLVNAASTTRSSVGRERRARKEKQLSSSQSIARARKSRAKTIHVSLASSTIAVHRSSFLQRLHLPIKGNHLSLHPDIQRPGDLRFDH